MNIITSVRNILGFLRKNPLLTMACLVLAFSASDLWSQVAEFETQMKTANTSVWSYVIVFVNVGCALFAIFFLYQLIFSSSKFGAAMMIFGLLAFVVSVNNWDTIWTAITGKSAFTAGGTP